MDIGFYKWAETDQVTKERIMRRSEADIDAVIKDVQPIIEDVRTRGDAALIDYAKKFDKCDLASLKINTDLKEHKH